MSKLPKLVVLGLYSIILCFNLNIKCTSVFEGNAAKELSRAIEHNELTKGGEKPLVSLNLWAFKYDVYKQIATGPISDIINLTHQIFDTYRRLQPSGHSNDRGRNISRKKNLSRASNPNKDTWTYY